LVKGIVKKRRRSWGIALVIGNKEMKGWLSTVACNPLVIAVVAQALIVANVHFFQ